ncbi:MULTISPECIES: DGQHR domain-containing protein DpdB [unclassified Nocardioides]|uniref:DGQHR domain-containing protein DpdB n=1 Tax=unclassified Nocardioides TaxID=2615069 RepID=UPI0009F068DB|nr:MULTISPECIES: DGQHR domain-containing protein DpdB [unclassified Nocardioides]GAW49251.1 DGQHR domain-containing protein [Nocardioides sp. PD653-B2]GAW55739.1 DGQHR domain-containing protein [Nocardioides sp. PD653]
MTKIEWLERRALKVLQSDNTPLYLFTLAAEEIDMVADVARISRDEAGKLIGYQRPEKQKHVKQIQEYLDSEDPLFPNGLILALPPEVRWRSSRGPTTSDGLAVAGTLEIPVASDPSGPRPAWIVDGQQRSLALSRTKNRRLPVPVAGFVASTLEIQREQFLRVNTVQPLPTGLVTELLPEITRVPSARMATRQLPSALVEMLNQDSESPFRGIIRRASTDPDSKKSTFVTDTSLIEAIRESIESPSGVLFPYRNIATGTTDTEGIRRALIAYWGAVHDVFGEAWAKPATESRLMHGVGIRAMGRLMDRVMTHVDDQDPEARTAAASELLVIAAHCAWTEGSWDGLGLAWNDLQNTTRHIKILSNYLVRTYLAERTHRK